MQLRAEAAQALHPGPSFLSHSASSPSASSVRHCQCLRCAAPPASSPTSSSKPAATQTAVESRGVPFSAWSPQLHAAVLRVADTSEVDITAGAYRTALGTTRRTAAAQLPEMSHFGDLVGDREGVSAAATPPGGCGACTCRGCECLDGLATSGEDRRNRSHRSSHRRRQGSRSGRRHHDSMAGSRPSSSPAPSKPPADAAAAAPHLPSATTLLAPAANAPTVASPYRNQEVLERIMAKYRTPSTPPAEPAQQQPLHIFVHCGCSQAEQAPDATASAGAPASTTKPAAPGPTANTAAAAAPASTLPPMGLVPPPPPGTVTPPPPPAAPIPPPPPPPSGSLSVASTPTPAGVGPLLRPPPPSAPVPVVPPAAVGAPLASGSLTAPTDPAGDKERQMLLEKADKYVWQLEQEVQHRALHYKVMLQQLAEEEARSAALRHDRDALLALNGGLQASLDYARGSSNSRRQHQHRRSISSSSTSPSEATVAASHQGESETCTKEPPPPQQQQPLRRLPPAVECVYASLQTTANVGAAATSLPPSPPPTSSTAPSAVPPPSPTSAPAPTPAAAAEGRASATQEVLRHILFEREVALQSSPQPSTTTVAAGTTNRTPHPAYSDELRRYVDRLYQEAEAGAAHVRRASLPTAPSAAAAASASSIEPSPPPAAYQLPPNYHTIAAGAGTVVPIANNAHLQLQRQRQSELEQLRAEVALEGERMKADTQRWRAYLQQQHQQQR
ncbi:hypothetical protein JIQ42_05553 [Leishmania sp. Namibia]|uniref:hypothetical protein n=1 Tax=Leishmania sp. Namibia TaxID=2802991 RepID=UPI001B7321A3|nr:hypothetical protein JIQ42_05553 [Leishmania sp. Namibia]